jgi:ribosomal protein S1
MERERPLGDEVDEALEGINLQEVDLEPVPTGREGAEDAKTPEGLTRGTVVGVDGDDVIVDLGPRMQGVISVEEFDEPPAVGAAFDFSLAGRDGDLWILSRKEALVLSALEDLKPGSHVKAKVTGQNTGGLELKVSGLSGFMPASHVALGRVEDLSTLLSQHLVCEVLEVDREKKRLLLSRRNVLRKELEDERRPVPSCTAR